MSLYDIKFPTLLRNSFKYFIWMSRLRIADFGRCTVFDLWFLCFSINCLSLSICLLSICFLSRVLSISRLLFILFTCISRESSYLQFTNLLIRREEIRLGRIYLLLFSCFGISRILSDFRFSLLHRCFFSFRRCRLIRSHIFPILFRIFFSILGEINSNY